MHVLSSSLIILLGAGVLTACGGGGGDGDTGPAVREAVALTAGNGQRIAQGVVEGGETVTSTGGATVFSAGGPPDDSRLPGLRALVHDLALERIAAGVATGDVMPAASQAQSCADGGTVTVGTTDKNNNGRVDAGDSASITYNNCAQAGLVQSGTVSMQVVELQGDPGSTSADWAFRLGVLFSTYSVSAEGNRFTLNGGFDLAASYRASTGVYRFTTAGSQLAFSDGTNTAQLVHFNFVEALASASSQHTSRYDFVYDASEFAGSVTVVTQVPFSSVEGFPPESGRLTIRGANDTRVVVQATGGGTARISIDANGDGDFTDSEDRVINGQWTDFFG